MLYYLKRVIYAFLLTVTLALGGCQSSPSDSSTQESASVSASSASSGAVEDISDQSSSPSSEVLDDARVQPILPGIGLQNYPTINGSTANHPLIARLYADLCGITVDEAETLVNLDLGSTGSIWDRFLNGQGPDVLIAYEPPEDIKANYAQELAELEIDPLGRDGLVFVANAKNPVESLTVEELQKIYTAQLTDWSQVGGDPGSIRPFQRNADSGSQTLFLKLLMQGLTPMDPPTALVQQTMGGLIDGVAAFDGSGGALGYSVYYYAKLMYANPDLKLLAVDGVAPSNESIQSGEYPLTNDFYVAIRADEPAHSPARQVRDWLLTDAGRRLLEEENYVWAREGLPKKSYGPGNAFHKDGSPASSAAVG